MNALKERVDGLNTMLARHFAGCKLHGLSIQVGRGEETLIKDLEDDRTPLVPDDSYNMWCYHRLIDDEQFSDPVGRGSGNEYSIVSPMAMIVHTSDIFNSDRLIRLLQKEDDIVLQSRSTNYQAIASREFGQLDKFDFKNYLFEIRYSIISNSGKCR